MRSLTSETDRSIETTDLATNHVVPWPFTTEMLELPQQVFWVLVQIGYQQNMRSLENGAILISVQPGVSVFASGLLYTNLVAAARWESGPGEDQFVILRQTTFYARYGNIFAEMCTKLKTQAEAKKLDGWQMLQKHSSVGKSASVNGIVCSKP